MRTALLAIVLLLAGCDSSDSDSGSSSSSSAPAQAVAASSAAQVTSAAGRVTEAPAGTVVHLVEPTPTARTLLEQAQTIVASVEVDAEGRFAVSETTAREVLVSAPGRALTRAPLVGGRLASDLVLAPEAICTVTVGAAEEDAMGLVLDDTDRVVAAPPSELVADATGTLRATRLPAGRYRLIVGSADGQRFASAAFSITTGGRKRLSLTLTPNPEEQVRFLRAVGHPEAGSFLEEVGR